MVSIIQFLTASPRHAAWSSTILVRIIVGLIFILAAWRKFSEPETMGPGRFEGMGFANPMFWSTFVGVFELLGGLFVLIGLLTRAAALPLAVTMVMALWLTKVPKWPDEPLVDILHAARLDFALLLLAVYLMVSGGGAWAVDRAFDGRWNKRNVAN